MHLVDDFKGKAPSWDYGESPFVDGDRVIVTPGQPKNTMVALKASDGSTIWSGSVSDLPEEKALAGYSSPIKAQINGQAAYVTMLHVGYLVAFDGATGKYLFNDDAIKTGAAAPTCTAVGDRVFCSAGYGKGGGVQWDVSGPKPKVVWKQSKLSDTVGSPVKLGNRIFGSSDNNAFLYSVDWTTGEVKSETRRVLGTQSAGFTIADGKLIVVYSNGVASLFSADDNLTEISNFVLPGADPRTTTKRYGTPVVAGLFLFLRLDDKLFCYNLDPAKNTTPGTRSAQGLENLPGRSWARSLASRLSRILPPTTTSA